MCSDHHRFDLIQMDTAAVQNLSPFKIRTNLRPVLQICLFKAVQPLSDHALKIKTDCRALGGMNENLLCFA